MNEIEEEDLLAEDRAKIVGFVTAACFCLILPFVINNVLQGRWLVSACAFAVMVVLFSNFVSIWMKKKSPIDVVYLIPAVASFLAVCFQKQGLIGAFWCYPALVSHHFMFTPKRASIAEKTFLLTGLVAGYYSLEFHLLIRFMATLVMTTLFCRLFLNIIAKQQSRLISLGDDLMKKVTLLEQSNRQIARSEDHRRRFLATVSHEFRTPMNAIVGFTDLALRREVGDKNVRRDLARISNAAKNLVSLLNDILDFSKIEAGKLIIKQERFSIETVLQDMEALFSSTIAAKGLGFRCHRLPGTPQLMIGDLLRVEQVLTNLIGNAIKFTNKGKIEVLVGEVHGDSSMVEFRVSDTGIGIAPDKIDNLFQPFHQLDSSLQREVEGTGLGLTISRNLVELMGGELEARSNPGSGSVFTFRLPLEGHGKSTDGEPARPTNQVLILHTEPTWLDDALRSFRFEPLSFAHPPDAFLDTERDWESFRLLVVDSTSMNRLAWTQLSNVLGGLRSRPRVLVLAEATDDEQLWPVFDRVIRKPLSESSLLDAIVDLTQNEQLPLSTIVQDEAHSGSLPYTGRHILVVDDVAPNRELAEELLHRLGASTRCVRGGRQALDLIGKERFDVVLMDVNMPGMDGYEATRLWRETGDRSTPIIALTAHASETARDSAMAAGMNDHLPKPITLDTLYSALTKWIAPEEYHPVELSEQKKAPQAPSEDFPDIDKAEALERLAGSESLLRGMINSFRKKFRNLERDLPRLVESGDQKALAIKARKLKRAAANISANVIAEAAARLETASDPGEQRELVEVIVKSFRAIDALPD